MSREPVAATDVRISVAASPQDAVNSIPSLIRTADDPVVIVVAGPDGHPMSELAILVKNAMLLSGSRVTAVTPRSLAVSALRRIAHRPRAQTVVKLDDRAERISAVTLPTRIADARTLIVVNDLRHVTTARPTFAIGIWTQFAGWREAIGVRLSHPRDALAAEIALAATPNLVLLAFNWCGLSLVVTTCDQIAAELVGLALHQTLRGLDDEASGPWEDPLVQRATELKLGVRTPDQITLRGILVGDVHTDVEPGFRALVEEIGARLGVRNIAVRHNSLTSLQ